LDIMLQQGMICAAIAAKNAMRASRLELGLFFIVKYHQSAFIIDNKNCVSYTHKHCC
jgi:hypothetical protein